MPDFCVDANTFIRPYREGFYSFQLAPTFWQLLDEKAATGVIASPRRVYQELADYDDNLANWAIERRASGLFVDPVQEVQEAFTPVADYVKENYRGRKSGEFLGGADPWVIAQAIADNAVIVSYETRVSLDAQTPKIPNVAQAFGIRTINLYQMLQTLGAEITFRS